MDILYILLGIIAYVALLVWIAVEEIKHLNECSVSLMEVETSFPIAAGVAWIGFGAILSQSQPAQIFVLCLAFGVVLLLAAFSAHVAGSVSTIALYKRYRPIYAAKYFAVQVLMVLTVLPILLFWFVRYDSK